MAALAAPKTGLKVKGPASYAFRALDAEVIYPPGLVAITGENHGTPGRLVAYSGAAEEIPLGRTLGAGADSKQGGAGGIVTGDTSASPEPTATVELGEEILERRSVAGVSSLATSIGRLAYLNTDNLLDDWTLTRPTRGAPQGVIVGYHSGAFCDILRFSFATMCAIMLGGSGQEVWCLGSFDVTIAASANLATAILAPYHGEFRDFYAVIDGADLAGAGGDVDVNLEIGGTNLTGGVISLLIASPTAGTKVAGTAITAANIFNEGDAIDIEATVNTAFTTGRVNLYAEVGRLLGV
jgi:hypothetical protein